MTSRRDFVASASAGLAIGVRARPAADRVWRASGQTVLFQGDSITDCGRNRTVSDPNRGNALATGYPLIVASTLLRIHADSDMRFYNRGISGHKVPDLQARWQTDTIDLKPDVVSILVGVNDFWHRLLSGYQGTVADYERQLAELLDQTRIGLPGVRLVVLEPFVLRTGSVTDAWFPEFDERRAAARRAAQQARATFIPLHDVFGRLTRRAPAAYWAADGVHPTPAGHGVIAQAWMQAVRF